MSSARFLPDAAGLEFDDHTLYPGELGASLMERAQRGRLLDGHLQREATRLAADVVTSNLPHEQALRDLHQRQLSLHERERSTRQNTELRAGFDLPQFTSRVETIRDLLDPAAQLGAIGALRASYARYRAVPELTQLMEEQFASLEPVIAANQESRLHERITANRYALTPEDAAKKFPGYRITPTVIPNGTTANGGRNVRLIYLAEDDVDPRLEAEAFQLLRTASAWADPAKLEALDRDPTVAAVLRVPGSKFAAAYIDAIANARRPPALSTAADLSADASSFPVLSEPDKLPRAGHSDAPPLAIAEESPRSESESDPLAHSPNAPASDPVAATAPETTPPPVDTTLEDQLSVLKSADANWREQRPVEARTSLGGSPYVDRISAVESGIALRDHLLGFLEIVRLQRLRDAAEASNDEQAIGKLNREIRKIGRKVFGQSITGITDNGDPIASVDDTLRRSLRWRNRADRKDRRARPENAWWPSPGVLSNRMGQTVY